MILLYEREKDRKGIIIAFFSHWCYVFLHHYWKKITKKTHLGTKNLTVKLIMQMHYNFSFLHIFYMAADYFRSKYGKEACSTLVSYISSFESQLSRNGGQQLKWLSKFTDNNSRGGRLLQLLTVWSSNNFQMFVNASRITLSYFFNSDFWKGFFSQKLKKICVKSMYIYMCIYIYKQQDKTYHYIIFLYIAFFLADFTAI